MHYSRIIDTSLLVYREENLNIPSMICYTTLQPPITAIKVKSPIHSFIVYVLDV